MTSAPAPALLHALAVHRTLRLSVVVGLALLLPAACKKDPPPPATDADRDAALWAWTKANLDDLRAVKTGSEPVTAGLAEQLERVDKRLAFELGVGKDAFELIISADGNPAVFPVVKRLVAAAPPLKGVKVIAFRPRKGPGFQLEIAGTKVGFEDVLFTAAPDPKTPSLVAVTLYLKHLDEKNREAFLNAAFILLELALGEYDVATKLGQLELKALPEDAAGLRPLAELPAVVDGWKAPEAGKDAAP